MSENNSSTLERKETATSNLQVAVNSIQRTLLVERLRVNVNYPADRIIPYDDDNLYPNKCKSIALRSGTTKSCISKLSEFLSGAGFEGMNQVINGDGQTGWDLLRFITDSKSLYGGYSLHFNYNLLGQITEINPVNFEFVRWAKDLNRHVVNPDWYRRNRRAEEITYNQFNPTNVGEEINEAGGIDNYKGQLFYWIPNLADYYCVTDWDSVLDDAQFEAEAKIYALSSIQNDYSLAGIISYPKNLADADEIERIKNDIKGDKGAANAGGIRIVGAMPTENLSGSWKWFTPISRNNIDGLHKNQNESAKNNIYAAFRMPPILCGVATSGMFNAESFNDAFDYYNSTTETERKDIERQLNNIFASSIWAEDMGEIEIKPKGFIKKVETVDGGTSNNTDEDTPDDVNADAQAALRGSVGGVQGILQIQQAVSSGITDYDAAITILKEIFGFTEEIALEILGIPEIKAE